MTFEPARATVPSGSATCTPSTRSRTAWYRWRSGPLSAVAISPPIVPPPGGSTASICPALANASCARATGTPVCTIAVRSPSLCSTIASRPSVDSSPSASAGRPQRRDPVPRMRSRRPSRSASCSAAATSEALGKACRLQRVLPGRPGHLAAQPRRRHDLARVGEPAGVERAAQLLERGQVGLVEHLRHVALLVDADPVLAGDRPALGQAREHDLAGQLLGALGLALAVADERVQVAVAGVEDVADLQPVLAREGVDALEHLGQPRARDHAVLHVVVRRDAAHGREGGLAHLPEDLTLANVAGDAHLG